MQLPQIRTESESAQIQIRTISAKQEITQPQATIEIEQPRAELKMDSKPAKLHIDQSQAWEDMNILSVFKSGDRFASEGMSSVQEGMARRAEEGKEMMRIENMGNPIIDQAVQQSERPEKPIGIQFIPSYFAVQTRYEPGELTIDFKVRQAVMDALANRPEISYKPGKVETSLKQKASLDINFVHLFDKKQ